MDLPDAMRVLQSARTDQVLVTTMASAREWMLLGNPDPRDFEYVPSSMGQAPALGLGIALAKPETQVIVCNGDGGMLMNLGALVTIAAAAPRNFVMIVFDNGVYEVTGAQLTPAAVLPDNGRVDLCEVARGCGWRSVFEFRDLESWRTGVRDLLAAPGPAFAVLRVAPMPGAVVPKSPAPARARAAGFRDALGAKSAP